MCPDNQGAKSGGEMESAQAKNQALMDAGAVVPTSYEAFETSIKETFAKLVCPDTLTKSSSYFYFRVPSTYVYGRAY